MPYKKYEVDDTRIDREKGGDLLRRINDLELSEQEKEVLRALVDGGFYFGGQVGANDGDGGIAVKTMLKLHFEEGVNAILRHKKLEGQKRQLACDLSSFGYREGERTFRARLGKFSAEDYDKHYSKSMQRVMAAIS